MSRAVIGSLLECRIEVTVPEAIPQQFDLIAHLDTSSHQDHWLMSGKTKVRLSFTVSEECSS